MRQYFACAILLTGVALATCPASTTDWLSPINLQGPRFAPEFKKLTIFSTGEEGLPIENTGDTVKVTFPIHFSSDKRDPNANLTDVRVSHGPLLDKYTASHMEFRWGTADSSSGGSDHGFGGVYFPLELQLYLYNTKYQNWDDAVASSPTGPILGDFNADIVALSLLFKVGTQNDELSRITDRLELIRTSPASNTILSSFCFEKVLGQHKRDFYTYTGSTLSTPCVQGVRWIVLTEPLTVSQTQLNQFQAITNAGSPITFPARVSQALNGRLVEINVPNVPVSNTEFQPEFYPHGPPVTVANPLVGGVVIDQGALNADDAANRNYFSPLDKTLDDSDDSDSAAAAATGPSADSKLAADAASGVSDESSAPAAADLTAEEPAPADPSAAAADDASAAADASAAPADENAIGDNGAVLEGAAASNNVAAAPIDPPQPDAGPAQPVSSPADPPQPDAGPVDSTPSTPSSPPASPPSDGAPPVGDGSTPPPPTPSPPTDAGNGVDGAVPVSAPEGAGAGASPEVPPAQTPEEGASQQPDGSTTTGASNEPQPPPAGTTAVDDSNANTNTATPAPAADTATTAAAAPAVSSAQAAHVASSTGHGKGKGKPRRHQDPIPHFFYLSSTAMFTPEFEPRQHNHEDDHDPNNQPHHWASKQAAKAAAAAAAADPNEAIGADEAAEADNTGSLFERSENILAPEPDLRGRRQRQVNPFRKLVSRKRGN